MMVGVQTLAVTMILKMKTIMVMMMVVMRIIKITMQKKNVMPNHKHGDSKYMPVQRVKGNVKGLKVFKIMLDCDVYRPGDTVRGELIVWPKKNLKLRHIRMKWVGVAKTRWRDTIQCDRTENLFLKFNSLFPNEEDIPQELKKNEGGIKGKFLKFGKKKN